ncbi:hypothetical protein PR048_033531 [Dryococelus australis]|uniref:Uncharacterized protein n=1 Tax=Dryococelus australis TaxID=614101 RepID=A0ABQ9G3L5_9NEOP|nr:hypothetical protein PR048_033531 [Dryococelus australis]
MGAMSAKHTEPKAIFTPDELNCHFSQQHCKPDNRYGYDEISIKLICLILPLILPTLTDIFNFAHLPCLLEKCSS